MNPLTRMLEQLAVSLTADPLLLLASAVATFDPFWAAFDEPDIDYETDPLTIALQVTRGAFPDIYALAVERLRAGATGPEMDRLLCKAISARGIPLDDLSTIGWGVPLNAIGVDLEDPEFYAVHSDLLPILAAFGIDAAHTEARGVSVPESARTIGRAIAHDLHQHTDPALRQLAWLFAWLFACSGNSLIDLSDDELCELQPLSWSAEDVAFAIELIEEADGILRDVQAGIDYLKQSPELRAALKRNVAHLYRVLKQKGKLDERSPRLCWASALSSADGATIADPVVLQLRPDAA